MAKLSTIEEFAKKVSDLALDEFEHEGKTIREWIELILNGNLTEVVRCKECKHHYWEQEPCHGKIVHYCKLPHMRGVEVFKEFFCYYGDRKEGAD